MISSDQRSPNLSSAMLTGHPERPFDLGTPDTRNKLSNVTCNSQAIWDEGCCKKWLAADAGDVSRIFLRFGPRLEFLFAGQKVLRIIAVAFP